mgnify:CR=1 FL=1
MLRERAQTDVVAEDREDPLPPPRRQHEAEGHEQDAGGPEGPGPARVVRRDEVVEVDLGEQDREEGPAHEEPQAEPGV